MKRIIFLLALIFSLAAQGQTIYGNVKYMTTLGIPKDTLRVPTDNRNMPHIAILPGDNFYLWSTSLLKWVLLSGGGGGTTYTNGYGLTLTSNTFRVDTTGSVVSKLRLAKALDSLRGTIPTLYTTDGTIPSGTRTITNSGTLIFNGGVYSITGTVAGMSGSSNVGITSANLISLQSGNVGAGTYTQADMYQDILRFQIFKTGIGFAKLEANSVGLFTKPTFTLSADDGGFTNRSALAIGQDNIVFTPSHGIMKIASLQSAGFDTTNVKPMGYKASTQEWVRINYWPVGTGGGGGSGTGHNIYFENIIKTGFDSTFYWRNDSTISGRAYKLSVGSNKLAMFRPTAENSDTTTSWQIDVTPGNIDRNTMGGGALSIANGGTGQISAAAAAAALLPTTSGQSGKYLTNDGSGGFSWGTPAGGGGSGTPGGSTTQVQYNAAGSFAGSANFTWDNTNKVLGLLTGARISLWDATNTNEVRLSTSSNDLLISNPGHNGQFRLLPYGNDVYWDNNYPGDIIMRPGTVEKFRVKNNGNLVALGYASGSTAPTTSGTKHMLTVDANGLLSHETIPTTGSGTVSSFSFTNGNGFTGTVSTATTTPALLLSLQNAAADGSTKGQAAFSSTDFNASSGVISLKVSPRTAATALTAAGTNQSTALALSGNNSIQEITTAASGTGVKLPTASATSEVVVVNRGANNITVYPATSGTINNQAANAGFTLPAGGSVTFQGKDGTGWYTGQSRSVGDAVDGDGTGILTVSGLRNVALPSLSAGFLKYTGSAFAFDNTTYVTAASNIGTGTGLYSSVSSGVTQFKSILAGPGTSIQTISNDVVITSTPYLAAVTSNVGNVGTGEDDLMSYSLGAAKLTNDGDFIEFEMQFNAAINSNSKTINLYFGSENFATLPGIAAAGGYINFRGKIIRVGATSQKVIATWTTLNSGSGTVTSTLSQTLSGAITIKATGTAVANNDIVQNALTVTLISKQ